MESTVSLSSSFVDSCLTASAVFFPSVFLMIHVCIFLFFHSFICFLCRLQCHKREEWKQRYSVTFGPSSPSLLLDYPAPCFYFIKPGFVCSLCLFSPPLREWDPGKTTECLPHSRQMWDQSLFIWLHVLKKKKSRNLTVEHCAFWITLPPTQALCEGFTQREILISNTCAASPDRIHSRIRTTRHVGLLHCAHAGQQQRRGGFGGGYHGTYESRFAALPPAWGKTVESRSFAAAKCCPCCW